MWRLPLLDAAQKTVPWCFTRTASAGLRKKLRKEELKRMQKEPAPGAANGLPAKASASALLFFVFAGGEDDAEIHAECDAN